jgi:hypothetical protein
MLIPNLGGDCPAARLGLPFFPSDQSWSKTMAREELKWQNIDADDLPAEVKKSFDAWLKQRPRSRPIWKGC